MFVPRLFLFSLFFFYKVTRWLDLRAGRKEVELKRRLHARSILNASPKIGLQIADLCYEASSLSLAFDFYHHFSDNYAYNKRAQVIFAGNVLEAATAVCDWQHRRFAVSHGIYAYIKF